MIRAIAALGLVFAARSACALGAERSDGPDRGFPSGRAEERSAWGGHGRRSAHAS